MGGPLYEQRLNPISFSALRAEVMGMDGFPIHTVIEENPANRYEDEYWTLSTEPVPPAVWCIGFMAGSQTVSALVNRIQISGKGEVEVYEGDREYPLSKISYTTRQGFEQAKREVRLRRIRDPEEQHATFQRMAGIAAIILEREL